MKLQSALPITLLLPSHESRSQGINNDMAVFLYRPSVKEVNINLQPHEERYQGITIFKVNKQLVSSLLLHRHSCLLCLKHTNE
jgi:hypothetical protein